ncbi:MAG: hypothetical protein LC725_10575, partial [Lentisphaerae bacterium]|nr:hypothetical protein [Lentisphaerota bacterium]
MISDYHDKIQKRRLWLLWLLMLAGLSFLLAALWRIQVGMGAHYEGSLERQSVRRVRIPGMRGRIFDRNGECLADNSPSYGIAIYLEELRQGAAHRSTVESALAMVQRIADLTGLVPQVGRGEIERHLQQRRALPLLAWDNIRQREMARLAESAGDLHAVGIVVDALRVYPQGRTAGHLLGYVGKLEVVEEDQPY